MNLSRIIKITAAVMVAVFFLTKPSHFGEMEFPVYTVVIDPGHGGSGIGPIEKHGDKFDTVSGTYLQRYAEGAGYGKLHESEIMYSISEKVIKILKLTETEKGYNQFRRIMLKYAAAPPRRVIIKSYSSRNESINTSDFDEDEDINAPFRLYDFPDSGGKMNHGRISYINSLKPQLVVSLHCDSDAPADHRGIAAVAVPPFEFMKKALWFIEDRNRSIDYFRKSPYNQWFIEDDTRSAFQWHIDDAAAYFIGYGLNKNYSVNFDDFKGIRYNMTDWIYKDTPGWEQSFRDGSEKHYAKTLTAFDYTSAFWEREKSDFEKFRRDGGSEGYGGDNLYASNEVIRFILTSLKMSGNDHKDQYQGNPYFSTWSIPLYINAVSAFIELGYLKNERYRKILTENQDEIAEGISMAVYSLVSGMELKDFDYEYGPKGERIDFQKYNIGKGKTYFNVVTGK
ncbi:MAG: N-acetylmuramoyl-L-alanine amidase [Spirochaetes bacterium]|nr:N-acetylmuramoyl-L-alanine amidase [Spirochaetota bacterium]